MKRITLLLLSSFCLLPSSFGQGSLTPPGPPAPTMKTLEQVEPRTPISTAPFTISQSGSYYLTTNLTVAAGNAITIAADGVTLDLNGFTISSTANPAAGYAVLINSGLRNIAIQNGVIQGAVTYSGGVFSGSGFGYGISYSGTAPQNVRVSGVSVSGCQYDAIYVGAGESTLVENCVVRTAGGYGIMATTIRGCVARECGGTGIYGIQVSDSRGETVGSSSGLYATTAQNCYGSSSSGSASGIEANVATNCRGYSNTGTGLHATTAQNCYGSSSSGYGLVATTAENCYGFSSSGYYGLYAVRTAIGCYGFSSSGTAGLYAQNANTCVGSRSSGTAIKATIANGCWAASGTNSITYKYNMP